VEQRISERPELLSAFEGLDERTFARAKERITYWGRYSAKKQMALDEALDVAAAGVAASLKTAAAGKLRIRVTMAEVGDEHMSCQRQAFPYTPSWSLVQVWQAFEARAAEDTDAVTAGTLLGYIVLETGGYIDEVAVRPEYQGHGVASALLAGSALAVMADEGRTLCVDVRSGNTPALGLFKALGFKAQSLQHPGFFDWDGGYYCEATAKDVSAHVPANAEILIT